MSHRALGPMFTVYRGLDVHPDKVDTDPIRIGRHWTTEHDVALNQFASAGFGLPGRRNVSGTVVEALAHPNDVVKPGSEEWKELGGGDYESGYGIFSPEHSERETTIKGGSQLQIVALHHYEPDESGKPRKVGTRWVEE